MTEALHVHWGEPAQVVRWVHESGRGVIQGCDGQGRVVVTIPAGPLFGERLAAAFKTPSPPDAAMPVQASVASRLASVASSQARG